MIRESYRKFYKKQSDFYLTRPRAKKLLVAGNYALTAFVFCAYALLCLAVPLRSKPEALQGNLLRILLIPFLCLIFVSFLRNAIDRKRPYEEEGILPVIPKKKKGHSFPSRHVASAFVIGTVFLFYCVPLGAAILLSGLILAYVRFAAGLHYPSDLLAGAAIGVLFGVMAFI